jgi:hypothetical protein
MMRVKVLAHCLLLSCVLLACQPAPTGASRPREQTPATTLPEARYEAVQPTLIQQDEQGKTLWKLQAKSLSGQTGAEGAEGVLQEVEGWLYREGKPVLHFTARYARAHSERREIEAWGEVQAISNISRARLQAERILWRAREDRLIASGGVTIQWGELRLHDERLVLDTALQRATSGE